MAILSYNGQLQFAITGDYDTAPDIGVLADGVDAALATLLPLAGDGSARSGNRRTRTRKTPAIRKATARYAPTLS